MPPNFSAVVLLLCWRASVWASIDHFIWSTTGVQLGDPLGSLLFSLMLHDFLTSCPVPDGLYCQLWYLDEGILMGTLTALSLFLNYCSSEILPVVCTQICVSVGFWPSGDQSFADFPTTIKHVVFPQAKGFDFQAPHLGFS